MRSVAPVCTSARLNEKNALHFSHVPRNSPVAYSCLWKVYFLFDPRWDLEVSCTEILSETCEASCAHDIVHV